MEVEREQEEEEILASVDDDDHPYWSQIDLAERYLVSGMFDDAATLATSILKRFTLELQDKEEWEGHGIEANGKGSSSLEIADDVIDDMDLFSEKDDIVEATTMVLIQAYNESGRCDEIFYVLEQLFGSVANVPSSILLTGVCLQIFSGHLTTSRSVLEDFLHDWSSESVLKGSSFFIKSTKRAVVPTQTPTRVYLTRESFEKIADFYAVKVLTEGLKQPNSAISWLEKANLPENKKEEISEKVKLSLVKDSSKLNESLNKHVVTRAEDATKYSETSRCKLVDESEEDNSEKEFLNKKSKEIIGVAGWKGPHFFSSVAVFLSKLIVSSFGLFASSSTATQLRALKVGPLVGGAVTLICVSLLYKQRLSVRRIILKSLSTIMAGLIDIWRLAFNVQLNPLAAVQPAYSGSRVNF